MDKTKNIGKQGRRTRDAGLGRQEAIPRAQKESSSGRHSDNCVKLKDI